MQPVVIISLTLTGLSERHESFMTGFYHACLIKNLQVYPHILNHFCTIFNINVCFGSFLLKQALKFD